MCNAFLKDSEEFTKSSVTLHQVLGNYRKRNSSELSLEEDDIIRVVEKSECGWYYAELVSYYKLLG